MYFFPLSFQRIVLQHLSTSTGSPRTSNSVPLGSFFSKSSQLTSLSPPSILSFKILPKWPEAP
ncbi:hypothetical protein IPA_03515 [Ignicoccus pacificus DSM 13166]|uniref:Uncharacterized protein n=1 Tax=Ignicoccus pacificus DSM 13166 TaxID=940294 RepID=A0A977PKT7_9CREN|nr:hypothetical protein IPA_03515 [Ignicoccus pacificus DSM 13166]